MNFFEHQEAARRRTSLLVGYYALAVLAIIVALYTVVVMLFQEASSAAGPEAAPALWNPVLFGWVALGVGGMILIGTLYKIATLRGGGEAVAVMLGGRPVQPNTTDVRERRLLNVVEEMAVASGTPIPRVFLLDGESGINAFAAGFTPSDAVIGVTRGTIETLTRDELQGVIAHEFSHIFNGDMRLNIRLIGILHGILMLALAGYWIFRFTAHSSSGSRQSSRKEKGNGAIAIVMLGLAMWIIGYIGVFFANLIKSAISRQREFLADASAVQFTRNPLGIGGALKKIGSAAAGSRLAAPKAQEASHLYFANGIRESFLGLLATHPPLAERIQRIDPQFSGDFAAAMQSPSPEPHADAGISRLAASAPAAPPLHPPPSPLPPPLPPRPAEFAVRPAAMVDRIGTLQPEHLAYATELLAALPQPLRDACREWQSAKAVIYGLLLSPRPDVLAGQRDRLAAAAAPAVYREVERLAPILATARPEMRLPLADMALAALRQLPAGHYAAFRETVFALAAADSEISLFEYAVLRMLVRRLDPVFGVARRPVARHTSLEAILPESGVLLSGLAWFGHDKPDEAARAFALGLRELGAEGRLELKPRGAATLKDLDQALDRLAEASPALHQKLLAASTACVSADGRVTVDEAEALRAVADSFGCPMPPLLANAA
jgi:Zn-dependent protease with chaperone function